jgi:hypothetical protein
MAPGNPKPNAVKYKVPLTTKSPERLIHLSKKSQRGTRNPISLQLEQECHSLVNRTPSYYVLMVVTFHRLTRSLPLDIDAKVSFYNQHLL